MCIAIVKPQGKNISDSNFLSGFTANPDGVGFAYAHEGKLYVKKGYFDAQEALNAIREVQEQYDNPTMIIHGRYASHGDVNEDNCHPFNVSDTLAVIHNGIMPSPYTALAYKSRGKYSDTHFYNERILKPLFKHEPDFYKKDSTMLRLESHITQGNKLCFLDSEGFYSIANEQSGFWDTDGCWYSNGSCHRRAYEANPFTLKASLLGAF